MKFYQDSFGVENWVDETVSSTITFPTLVLDLSKEEARAIIHSHRDYIQSVSIFTRNKSSSSSSPSSTEDTYVSKVTEKERSLLQDVEARLDEAIKTFPNGGAFVKLHTRSPKDAPYRDHTNPDLQKLVFHEIEQADQKAREYHDDHNSEEDKKSSFVRYSPNTILIGFLKAMNKAMGVRTGAQALKLLTVSDRVAEDLSKNESFDDALFFSKLVVREFDPRVAENPHLEFRSFVYDRNLNAISQYFSNILFDEFRDFHFRELVQNRIRNFYETVKDKLPYSSCVIDFFAGFGDDENNNNNEGKTRIIEVNPFHNGAGACNFSWAKDRQVFMGGPQEWRFTEVEATEKDFASLLTVQWEKIILSEVARRKQKEEEENEDESAADKQKQKKQKKKGFLFFWK